MSKYILDVYDGDGAQGETKQAAGGNKREAMRLAREVARRKWDDVIRVAPADDEIISYGPRGGDKYVTVRRRDR